jgi:D-tyrosyl-tRNA(Tyr) deacylase
VRRPSRTNAETSKKPRLDAALAAQNSREFYGPTTENATMIALIQRVTYASVTVGGQQIAAIERGVLALIGIAATDTPDTGHRLLEKLLSCRIFPDDAGKMNVDLRQMAGGLLLVPQFTLLADTSKGTRPGFTGLAAPPSLARPLFEALVAQAARLHPVVAAGQFGADMQVSLVNDGPVTFWLEAG